MASTPQGRALTEAHRRAQLALRAEFLLQFQTLWPLLNSRELDRTAMAWINAVMPVIAEFREQSAQLTEDYYRAFRAAEAPEAALEGPAPEVTRERPADRRSARGRRASNPRTRESGRGRLIRPTITWGDADRAARKGLAITGPANIKSKTRRGKSPEEAAREAVVQAGGNAARHVLNGGRTQHLEMVREDAAPIGWLRVTDGDPCSFCAMLASRGPRYRSELSATSVVNPRAKRALGESYHDNCACTAEAMYSESQAWPGRGREWQQLWRENIRGNYSGDDAIRAWRRLYERIQREAEREAG